MYIRTRTRKIVTYLLVLLVILAGAFYAYTTMKDQPTGTTKDNTGTSKKEETKVFEPYTQYDPQSSACKYYYTEKGENCFVPLSFCAPDAEVKKTQTLDRSKYCSETPDLPGRALRAEGSVCPFVATEGDLINLKSIATDPDEQDPTHPFGPAGTLLFKFSAPFLDSNGIWQTQEGDAGVTTFDVSVTDGEYTSTKNYCIEVMPGNRPPYITNANDVTVNEGEVVKLNPICTDPDKDPVTLSYQGFLEDREWMTSDEKKTSHKDIGEHGVTITCVDKYGLKAHKSLMVTVRALIPEEAGSLVFTSTPKDMTMNEGETVVLDPIVTGNAEGTSMTYKYSGWMESNKKTASYEDSGDHYVTITATDGTSSISATITITVINVNRPPELVSTNEA